MHSPSKHWWVKTGRKQAKDDDDGDEDEDEDVVSEKRMQDEAAESPATGSFAILDHRV